MFRKILTEVLSDFLEERNQNILLLKDKCLEKLKQQGYEWTVGKKVFRWRVAEHPDSIKLKGF